jgi:hypothetical protein
MAGYPKYGQGRHGRTQTIDVTSVSAGVTSVLGTQTYFVRVAANTPIHLRVYDTTVSSTATSADPIVPVQVVEVVGVTPGQRISAIKASGGAVTSADGRVTITELS